MAIHLRDSFPHGAAGEERPRPALGRHLIINGFFGEANEAAL